MKKKNEWRRKQTAEEKENRQNFLVLNPWRLTFSSYAFEVYTQSTAKGVSCSVYSVARLFCKSLHLISVRCLRTVCVCVCACMDRKKGAVLQTN